MAFDEGVVKQITKSDITALALDSRFGAANFESSLKYLRPIQQAFVEIFSNDYKNFFSQNESNNIENLANQFKDYIIQLENFDPKNPDFSSARNAFENNIKGFFDSNISTLRNYELNLSFSNQKEKPDQKNMTDILKDLRKNKEDSDKIIAEYKKELELLKAGNLSKVQTGVLKLGTYFSSQAQHHSQKSVSWLKYRKWTIAVIFVFLAIFLLGIYFNHSIIPKACREDRICTAQFFLVKFLVLSLLGYMTSFFTKNYEVDSSLNVINQHKSNVANTIDEFLAVQQSEDLRSEIIKQGVTVMFQNVQDGYLSSSDHKTELNIIGEIANKIPKDAILK